MLDELYNPRAVAVIGASPKELSIGYRVTKNLLDHGFTGQVYPVHPKAEELLGLPVYKSVTDIEGPVDLVNVSIPAKFVPFAIKDCAAKGVKYAIIHTAGFAEGGEEGAALQAEVLKTAKKAGMRIYGPNSQGVMNSDPAMSLYANFTFTPLAPGSVSILAQSGGVAELLNIHLRNASAGFRRYASPGNASDIDLNELLEAFGADDGTNVILLHLESLKDPNRFIELASRITPSKPILALKSGKTEEGAQAATSHTGALMDQDQVIELIFKRAGVHRFHSAEEMVNTAVAMSQQPVPKGRRLGIISNAGGPGIIAVDEAAEAGFEIFTPKGKTLEKLKESQLPMAAFGTLVDLAATAGPENWAAAVETLLEDGTVDALLLVMVTPFFVDCKGVAEQVAKAAKGASKPVIGVVMTNENWAYVGETLTEAGIPVYDFPGTAIKILDSMTRYGELRTQKREEPPELEVDRKGVRKILKEASTDEGGYLTQEAAYRLIEAYGLPIARMQEINGQGQLGAIAQELGFPLVLKADTPEALHKTEAGAVVLNIQDEIDLVKAYSQLAQRFPGATMIAQQFVAGGHEIIAGAVAGGEAGAMVMFGLGGIMVELLEDVAFGLAPLSKPEARGLMESIKGYRLLEGFRGQAGGDLEAIEELLLRLSRLVTDFPQIVELDLNPVKALAPGQGVKVVDVRVKVQS